MLECPETIERDETQLRLRLPVRLGQHHAAAFSDGSGPDGFGSAGIGAGGSSGGFVAVMTRLIDAAGQMKLELVIVVVIIDPP